MEYEEIFGKGNFFLELQNHGMAEQKRVNEALIRMSKETGIPLIARRSCGARVEGAGFLYRLGLIAATALMPFSPASYV